MSFRFHLVSLVAIFLALALGIGMGATVIDKATVESLKRRVATVEDAERATNQKNAVINAQIARDVAFESIVTEYATLNALKSISVVAIGVRGADAGLLAETRKSTIAAGGSMLGTIWITGKAALSDAKSAESLRVALGSTTTDASQLRQLMLTRLAAVLAGTMENAALQPLLNEGFLEWEGQGDARFETAPIGGARIIFFTADTATVSNDLVAWPFVRMMAVQPTKRMIAVEAGRDADPARGQQGSRAVFVDLIRADSGTKSAVGTVDDIETAHGRVAVVLSLSQLGDGRIGHYGLASTAEGPIPKAKP